VARYARVLRRAVAELTADGAALRPTTYPERNATRATREAGMDAYPLMPFLLERLAPTYFQLVSGVFFCSR